MRSLYCNPRAAPLYSDSNSQPVQPLPGCFRPKYCLYIHKAMRSPVREVEATGFRLTLVQHSLLLALQLLLTVAFFTTVFTTALRGNRVSPRSRAALSGAPSHVNIFFSAKNVFWPKILEQVSCAKDCGIQRRALGALGMKLTSSHAPRMYKQDVLAKHRCMS